MPRRRTSSNPAPPSPEPPPLPPRPPLRSRRKSKSPSSRPAPKRAPDPDEVDAERSRKGSRDRRRSQGSELDAKWEDVALELRSRGGRMRSAVYQTSDLPSMVTAKRQAEKGGGPGKMGRGKVKATFV